MNYRLYLITELKNQIKEIQSQMRLKNSLKLNYKLDKCYLELFKLEHSKQ